MSMPLTLNPEFWKNKRVLITGHTGFKGSWLCEWLDLWGADVFGYALAPPTQPALFEQLDLAQRIHHQLGDVRDLACLRNFVDQTQPEVVFHMAAQPLVRQSYVEPIETYATNVMGTVHLLDACRDVPGLKAVVVITTDKCYENHEWHWGYRENEALGGYDPYSSSKACTELISSAYRRSFFNDQQPTRIATARAGNVIGGGDWAADRLIPDAIRAFQAQRVLEVRYPDAVRPWQHVLEPLHGYLKLAQILASEDGKRFADAWNFGPEARDVRPVRWIMNRLCELWPQPQRWGYQGCPQPHEAGFLKLDCAKAHAELEWWPALNLDEALQMTVSWYVHMAQGGDMAALTRQQIQNYLAKLNVTS